MWSPGFETEQPQQPWVKVLSGWSPGPLDALRGRMPDVECLSRITGRSGQYLESHGTYQLLLVGLITQLIVSLAGLM